MMSLHGAEMSLLQSRDLLDSFESAVIGLDGPFSSQDGVKSGLALLTYSAEAGGHGISLDHQVTGMDQDPFSSEWLDTKTDLLQYLTGVEFEPADNTEVEIPEVTQVKPEKMAVQAMPAPPQDPTEQAMSILKSLVEDTCQQLSSDPTVEAQSGQVPEVTMADLDLKEEDMRLLDQLAQSMQDTSDVMADYSVLSPISYDEVDSILSSGPCSPLSDSSSCIAESSAGDTSVGEVDMSLDLAKLLTQVQSQSLANTASFIPAAESDSEQDTSQSDPDYLPFSSPECSIKEKAKSRSKRSTKRLDPEAKLLERKLRKKQQNKDAATRYRQKKRAETELVDDEVGQLEKRNKDLRDSVDQMTREVSYIKNLLAEVYKSKGLI